MGEGFISGTFDLEQIWRRTCLIRGIASSGLPSSRLMEPKKNETATVNNTLDHEHSSGEEYRAWCQHSLIQPNLESYNVSLRIASGSRDPSTDSVDQRFGWSSKLDTVKQLVPFANGRAEKKTWRTVQPGIAGYCKDKKHTSVKGQSCSSGKLHGAERSCQSVKQGGNGS